MLGCLTVDKTRNGWSVIGAGVILKTFATNAQAWRWIDRRQGDIVSRSEAVSEWMWGQRIRQGSHPRWTTKP